MRHTFRGHKYRITFGRVSGNDDGECLTTVIHINRRLRGKAKLESELHKAIHACLSNASEKGVTETARDSAEMLWKRGYRLWRLKKAKGARVKKDKRPPCREPWGYPND